MPVMLSNQDGYYTITVDVRGSKFYVRDLGEHFDSYLDRVKEVQEAAGIDDLAAEGLDTQALVKRLVEMTADLSLVQRTRAMLEKIVDWVLSECLTRWDIAGTECTPETVCLLPPQVKTELMKSIIAESQLTLGEAGFPGGDGAWSPPR